MSIRTIIVDDEPVARTRLIRLLRAAPDIEIVGECSDGEAAVQAIRDDQPDLVLLDIQMPGMDGFDVLESLAPEERPVVIFVTAFDEYAVRAFEACALDYLLKPVAPERLMTAVQRATERLAVRSDTPRAQERFLVKDSGRVDVVPTDQIEWIEAAGNYAILHTPDRNHIIRQTMSSLESRLPADFLRVSRSAILNMRRVARLESEEAGGNVAQMQSGARVGFTRKISEVRARL